MRWLRPFPADSAPNVAVPADAQRFRYRHMVLPRALQRPDTLATRHAGRISRAARRHPRVLGQASSHTCSCFVYVFAHMSGSHLSSRDVSPNVCDRRFCRREEWLASIRAQRLRERRGVGVNGAPPRLTPGQRARELANILACAGTLLCWMQWSAGGWRLHLGGAIWCVAFMLKYGPGGQGRRA